MGFLGRVALRFYVRFLIFVVHERPPSICARPLARSDVWAVIHVAETEHHPTQWLSASARAVFGDNHPVQTRTAVLVRPGAKLSTGAATVLR